MRTPGSDVDAPASSRVAAPLTWRDERRGMPLSETELATLAAYAMTGDQRHAAAVMRHNLHTSKALLTYAYAKLGVHSAISAFRVLGWLWVPRGLVR